MEELTSLSANLDIAGDKAHLDRACKQILSEKMILAWIMKSCVEEYKNCTIQEIAEQYIEGTPQVSEVALHPNETNASSTSKVAGLTNEDSSINEGTIYYDIRFFALAPASGETIRLIINVEAQNKYYLSYPLVKRVMYYLGRLISSQYTVEFDHARYGELKKVYSIWICMNPPKERQNTITQYSMTKKDLVGRVTEPLEHYDLMTGIILCLGDKDTGSSEILKLLNVLLSKEESPSEKRRILQEEFEIPITQKLDEEVERMCNYSQYIEDRGIRKGIEKGRKEGIETGRMEGRVEGRMEGRAEGRMEGIESNRLESIRSLMETVNWTANEAMNALKVPEVERPKYIELLKQ